MSEQDVLIQRAQAAYNAGFRGLDLVRAVAITIPESKYDNRAIQQGQPAATTGWGAWQITPGEPSLLDLQTNANAAFKKYQDAGSTFRPWTTWPGSITADILAKATQAVTGIKGQSPVIETSPTIREDPAKAVAYALTHALNPVTMIDDAARQFGVSSSDLVVDIGMVVAGIALLLIGIYEGFKPPKK